MSRLLEKANLCLHRPCPIRRNIPKECSEIRESPLGSLVSRCMAARIERVSVPRPPRVMAERFQNKQVGDLYHHEYATDDDQDAGPI